MGIDLSKQRYISKCVYLDTMPGVLPAFLPIKD